MKKIALVLWALLLPTIALVPVNALAQGPVAVCYMNAQGGCTPAVQTTNSVKIAISTATTTEIIALVANKNIFVTSWDGVSSAAGTFKWVYGTGTACGTGTTDLTGTYAFGASTVVTKGNGLGPILIVPRGNALCATSASTINIQGSVSYAQF